MMSDKKHCSFEGPGQSAREDSPWKLIKDHDDLALASESMPHSGTQNAGLIDSYDFVTHGPDAKMQQIPAGSCFSLFESMSLHESQMVEEQLPPPPPPPPPALPKEIPSSQNRWLVQPPHPQPQRAQPQGVAVSTGMNHTEIQEPQIPEMYTGVPANPELEQLRNQILTLQSEYLRVAMGSQPTPIRPPSISGASSDVLGSAPPVMSPLSLLGINSGVPVFILPVAVPISSAASFSPPPSHQPQPQAPQRNHYQNRKRRRDLSEGESGSEEHEVRGGQRAFRTNLHPETTARGSSPKFFICPCHGTGFTTKFSRDRHVRNQTGVRREICFYCDKRTSTRAQMKRHIQTHTKEQPWPCPDCGKKYADRMNMERHRRRVHQWKKQRARSWRGLPSESDAPNSPSLLSALN